MESGDIRGEMFCVAQLRCSDKVEMKERLGKQVGNNNTGLLQLPVVLLHRGAPRVDPGHMHS